MERGPTTRRVLFTLPPCNDIATLFAKAVRRVGGGCFGAHLVIRPQPRRRQPQGSLFARLSRATSRRGRPVEDERRRWRPPASPQFDLWLSGMSPEEDDAARPRRRPAVPPCDLWTTNPEDSLATAPSCV